jgi:hypothetical protein
VQHHLAAGFTDFITGLPAPEHLETLRHVARELIPALRASALAHARRAT